jgi:hypothetical protein
MAALSQPCDLPGNAIANRVDDTVSAGDGNDAFDFAAAFTSADQVKVGTSTGLLS